MPSAHRAADQRRVRAGRRSGADASRRSRSWSRSSSASSRTGRARHSGPVPPPSSRGRRRRRSKQGSDMPVPAIIEVDAEGSRPEPAGRDPGAVQSAGIHASRKAAQIAEIAIPGIDSPILQFVRGQTRTLALELFFDTTRVGSSETKVLDVRLLTDVVAQLGRIQPQHPRAAAHPLHLGHWACRSAPSSTTCSRSSRCSTRQASRCVPRSTMSFKEYKTLEEQLKELNLQSADHTQAPGRCAGTTRWRGLRSRSTATPASGG